jgi:hypothetical protein
MSNTLVSLDVPLVDGTGATTDTSAVGSPKTFIFSGPATGRYIVEGSNDGATWDVLLGRDGTAVVFAGRAPGPKTVETIVKNVRVRSVGNGSLTTPPSLALGAPAALGTNVFGALDVPATSGFGAVFDLGLQAGPLKAFTARGPIPPGARYAIQGSIDGVNFDDVAFFGSDQEGARSVVVMCRFLRVQRVAFGTVAPVITVGAEGLFDPTTAASELTLCDEAERQTATATDEELLYQFPVPLKSLGAPILGFGFAAFSIQGATPGTATFRVRVGGTTLVTDGAAVLTVTDAVASEKSLFGNSTPFPSPTDDVALVKITGQGDGTIRPAMRGFAMLFHRST